MEYERDVEKYLIQRVTERGGLCIKLGVDGWPDRIVLWPTGRIDFVELKRKGARLRPLQEARKDALTRRRGRAFTLRSRGEIDGYMEGCDAI